MVRFQFWKSGAYGVSLHYSKLHVLVRLLSLGEVSLFFVSDRNIWKPHSVLGMTLNCLWIRGFSSGALGRAEYSLTAITPRSTVTGWDQLVRILSNGQMDLLKNYLYSIWLGFTPPSKKTKQKQNSNNTICKHEIIWTWFPNLRA